MSSVCLIIISLNNPVPSLNDTSIQFYDCRRNYSAFAVYGHNNASSLAASIVGIVVLFITVTYIWLVTACTITCLL